MQPLQCTAVSGLLVNRISLNACARRDQPTHNNVLLETGKFVYFACHGRIGQNLGGLLEGCRGNKAFRGQRRLGNPEKQRFCNRRLLAFSKQPVTFIFELPPFDLFADHEFRISGHGNHYPAQHLTDNDFNMLVIDFYALQTINFLNFIHQKLCQFLNSENPENVIGDDRSLHQALTGLHIIALMDDDMF